MEKFEELGLTNLFTGRFKERKLHLVNLTDERTSVSSMEIYREDRKGDCVESAVLAIDPADNLGMAVAMLGVGRVTEEVERRAQGLAGSFEGYTEEKLTQFAVTNLRAALIVRERNNTEEAKLTEEAFALCKLAYPDSSITEFKNNASRDYWVDRLRSLRNGPKAEL